MKRPNQMNHLHGLWASFNYALEGVAYAWRTQRNFRIECAVAAVVTLLGLYLKVNMVTVWLCCALVLSLELLNTALECVVDMISPEYHPLAKAAKDMAAAAVLIASAMVAVVGVSVFWPKIVAWF